MGIGLGLGLGLGTRQSVRAGGGVPPSEPVALDAPISSSMAGDVLFAWGCDRLVETFSGNTVRLKRLSDNAEADFGFDAATGIFARGAVDAWRAGADVDAVTLYAQAGASNLIATSGAIPFIRSGNYYALGTQIDPDGQVSRTQQGGIGTFTDGTASYGVWRANGLALTPSAYTVEFHSLYSTTKRKRSTATGGDSSQERIFQYGKGTGNYYSYRLGGNAAALTQFLTTNNGGTTSVNDGPRHKKLTQQVKSAVMGATNCHVYANGQKSSTIAIPAGGQTDKANGLLDNGDIVIAGSFSGTTNTTPNTTARLDGIFGALIITKGLSDTNRTLLQGKLSLLGQSHLRASLDEIMGYLEDFVVPTDIDGSSQAHGINGNVSFQIGKPGGSNNFLFDAAVPDYGFKSLGNTDQANIDNGYYSLAPYLTDTSEFTVVALTRLETTAQGDGLHKWLTIADFDPYDDDRQPNHAFCYGYHHSFPSIEAKAADVYDVSNVTGSRKYQNGSGVGDSGALGNDHTIVKYNERLSGARREEGATDNNWGVVINAREFENQPGSNLAATAAGGYDAPIQQRSYDNESFAYKRGITLLTIVTLKNGPDYDKNADYATRRPYMLTGNTQIFSSLGGISLPSHQDGDSAQNRNAAIYHPKADSVLQSCHRTSVVPGYQVFWGFARQAWTPAMAQKFAINSYKVLQAHAV